MRGKRLAPLRQGVSSANLINRRGRFWPSKSGALCNYILGIRWGSEGLLSSLHVARPHMGGVRPQFESSLTASKHERGATAEAGGTERASKGEEKAARALLCLERC